MGLVQHFEREWELAFPDSKDELQNEMKSCIKSLLQLFVGQGHSMSSAAYALSMFTKLASFGLLVPLTGKDDEWIIIEEDDDGLAQNKRCGFVFKEKTGECFNINGIVFSDDDGRTWYTNRHSRVPVTFPYMPPVTPEKIILKEHCEEGCVGHDCRACHNVKEHINLL